MNEPEIEHVLENRYVVEFEDAKEFDLVVKAINYAAIMWEDPQDRQAMLRIVADVSEMQRSYSQAHRRVADVLAEQFGAAE